MSSVVSRRVFLQPVVAAGTFPKVVVVEVSSRWVWCNVDNTCSSFTGRQIVFANSFV